MTELSDEEIASIYVVCQWARTTLEEAPGGGMDRLKKRKLVWDCLGHLEIVARRAGYPGHIQNYELLKRLGWWLSPPRRDIRISVQDTAAACKACIHLSNVVVLAIGEMYATIENAEGFEGRLTEAGISWSYD